MDRSTLVRLMGFPATLVHGSPLTLDRWLWLRRRLPATANGERLIDVGCGSGAFTIGAALRGYRAHGLSWDERNQDVARHRAALCNAPLATFEVFDIRNLDSRRDLHQEFDVAICLETIEHVIDDRKLLKDIAACLKPGGRLLLTTPNFHYRPISAMDNGPFPKVEDGWHVRRGYTRAMLAELCEHCGLIPERESYCSGFLSQKIASLFRLISKFNSYIASAVITPLRILPLILDRPVTNLLGWPYYSICLEAYKPRFPRF
jgi:SAM-dependent methyltransferase